jgi:hypothetical protein
MGVHVRPEAVREPADITGWYWTRAELAQIAAQRGLPRSGSKQHLQDVLVADLSGLDAPSPERRSVQSPLRAPFSEDMVIPAGQPFTRELRDWMEETLGERVRLGAAARALLRNPQLPSGQTATLADVIKLLVNPPPASGEVGSQFERNRFMRLLSRTDPGISRKQRDQAWLEFRKLPSAQRAERLLDVP